MSDLRQIVREIHRRSLWQVLGIYLVASWGALEVVDVLTANFGLPTWFPAFALGLLIVGLPVVLATAFVQEGGPVSGGGGARAETGAGPDEESLLRGEPHPVEPGPREETARPDPESPGTGPPPDRTSATLRSPGSPADAGFRPVRTLFTWRNALLGGMAAFALWGVVAAGWLLVAGPPAGATSAEGSGPENGSESSVAVLPFQNLSESPEADPFVNGHHDDLLTQLSKVEGLKVISRTSVMEYRDAGRNIRQIGRELGVGAVVEGGVQRVGDRIRLNAQLIDAESDEHLWAERYDRRLTTENVFEIQADLARRIADALRAELTSEEEARIAVRSTDDLEAYDFYVRALDYRSRGYGADDQVLAGEMLQRAVEEDPSFVEAWAALSQVHSFLYFLGHDRTPARLDRAREAADRAVSLAPESPEARRALGLYHYRAHQDYERALRELEPALEAMPGDAYLHGAVASVQRRRGRWEPALEGFGRTTELEPRVAQAHYELGATYFLLRRYREAREPLRRAMELRPEWSDPADVLAVSVASLTESADSGRAVLRRAPSNGSPFARWTAELWARDYAAALDVEFDGDPVETQQAIWPVDLLRAVPLLHRGREEEARERLESARSALDARLETSSDDHRVHRVLGRTLAHLDQEEAAVRHARRAVELYPVERDAVDGPGTVQGLAETYAVLGREERALDRLERLVRIPGWVSPASLLFDPVWDGIRDSPRFRRALDRVRQPADPESG